MRKMTWVILIWCGLILAWAIGGAISAQGDCGRGQLAQDACDAGTGIGVGIILFIGFIGFVFLSIIWFMTRPKGRPCPVCGVNVKPGLTKCSSCGHDFAAATSGASQPAAPQVKQLMAHRSQPSAGWFPAPGEDGEERYWNGTSWTDQRRPRVT